MRKTSEELKLEQKQYYVRLNEILVNVQDKAITHSAGENAIDKLNGEFPDLRSKASTCIIEAMTDEYANFDENSTC